MISWNETTELTIQLGFCGFFSTFVFGVGYLEHVGSDKIIMWVFSLQTGKPTIKEILDSVFWPENC